MTDFDDLPVCQILYSVMDILYIHIFMLNGTLHWLLSEIHYSFFLVPLARRDNKKPVKKMTRLPTTMVI
jgi:hypothetical protein